MITTQPDIHIETSGIETQKSFQIKASRKAFQILSSGLYSDKKLAIVREVLANSWDSHVCAHNPNPVLVHLPNSFEPYLSFRDYGTGLSDESMTTLYTTYFESTKTESNDFTGCLGLGSKSPLSYVDSFTVVSFFEGMKRTYNAYIDGDGVPSIARLHEEPTTEHNGLEVIIPVASDDFYEFQSKLETVCQRFKVQPKVVGCADFEVEPITYKMEGKGWGLRTEDDGNEMVAVMGNIGYPLDLTDSSLTPEQQALLKLPIDVHFNIGELDIAASREKLSFDAPTIANVKAKLNDVISEIRDIVAQKFSACQNLWDARCLAYEVLRGEYSKFSSLLKGHTAIQWNGQAVENSEVNHDSPLEVRLFQKDDGRYVSRYNRKERRQELKCGAIKKSIAPIRDTMFVLNDLSKGSYIRCRNYVASNNINLYLLTPSDITVPTVQPSLPNVVAPKPLTKEQQITTFATNIGIDRSNIISVSSLPHPPRATRTISERGKARILFFNGAFSYEAKENWSADLVDMKVGGVYVVIDRYKVNDTDPREYFESIHSEMKAAGLDISSLSIYGVKRGSISKVENQPQWKTLRSYCEDKITKALAYSGAPIYIANARAVDSFGKSCCLDMNVLKKEASKFKADGAFGKFVSAFTSMHVDAQSLKKWVALENVARRFSVSMQTAQPSHDLKALYQKALKTYPMLRLFLELGDTSQTKPFLNDIIEYVGFLD